MRRMTDAINDWHKTYTSSNNYNYFAVLILLLDRRTFLAELNRRQSFKMTCLRVSISL